MTTSPKSLRRFRPALESLEDRRVPALGTGLFIENFSDDLQPDQPGFDASGAFQHAIVGGSSIGLVSPDIPSSPDTMPSAPHNLFLAGEDRIAFPNLAADETIRFAEVLVAPIGATATITFQGQNDSRTVLLPPAPVWFEVAAWDFDLGDGGNPIGPITSIRVQCWEGLFDNITIFVEVILPNTPPQANDDSASVLPGQTTWIDVLANDGDPNGDALTISSVTPAALGTVEIVDGTRLRYTADSGAHGTDLFTYTIDDGEGGSAAATVAVSVNTPPVLFDPEFDVPHGWAAPFVVAAPGIAAWAQDAEQDPLTFALVSDAQFGNVVLNPADGSFTYTPATPFVRGDSFVVRAHDGFDWSNTNIVELTVSNQVPTALDSTVHREHGEVTGWLHGSLQAGDLDGDPLTAELVDRPEHGVVFLEGLNFSYYPGIGVLKGSDHFTFRVYDGYGGMSRTARVDIDVPNQAPQPRNVDFYLRVDQRELEGVIYDERIDPDFDSLTSRYDAVTFELVEDTLYGNLTLEEDGSFTYVPHDPGPDGFLFGYDNFRYRVSDGFLTAEAQGRIVQTLGWATVRSDAFEVVLGQSLTIYPADLLLNDEVAAQVRLSRVVDRLTVLRSYGDSTIVQLHAADGTVVQDQQFFGYGEPIQIVPVRPGTAIFHYDFSYRTADLEGLRQYSTIGSVVVHVVDAPQADIDGVSDAIESAIGDGNGDGVPDQNQDHVASLETVWGDAITLTAGGPHAKLMQVRSVDLPPGDTLTRTEFPIGFLDFRIVGLDRGAAATITIIVPPGLRFTDYLKYGREADDPNRPGDETVPHWYSFLFDGSTGAEFIDLNADGFTDRIVLHFVDGRRGDDDDGSGIIRDPGGPVFMPRATPATVYAVGADAGSLPQVQVRDRAGTELFTFLAYDERFAGGVRVALGDVTGDGHPDIITGAGPGGPPHVKVFDGTNLNLVRSFLAFDPGFLGGIFVAAGDVDADGHADIAVAADRGAGPHVVVFSGRDNGILQSFFAFDPGFQGGVRLTMGDVDQDGRPDLIVGAGPGGGSHVKTFSGRDASLLQSFMAFDAGYNSGVNLAVGDLDGDGMADILIGAETSSHVKAFKSDLSLLDSFFAFDPAGQSVRMAAIDYNGDGRADLVATHRATTQVRVIDRAGPTNLDDYFAFGPDLACGLFVAS